MKKCLKFAFFGLVLMSLYVTSCSDGAIGDDFADELYVPKGALVSAVNVVTGFFDQLNPSNSNIAFDLSAEGSETVTTADVLVSYNGGAEKMFTSVSAVPSTVNVNFTDVLALFSIAESDVAVGDAVTFTFDATTASGKYRSSRSLNVPVSCFSDLGGTYDYVSSNLVASNSSTPCPSGDVTGTVTFTDLGGGKYSVSDLGFGQYESSCWSDGPATSADATFSDICNEVQSGGLDQYSLVYTWVITDVSGPNLSISWSNDYADGGDVVITRPDGTDWPPLFTK
jgi:hypothetical protein